MQNSKMLHVNLSFRCHSPVPVAFLVSLMLDLRVCQRPVLAERLQCSWADVQYLAHVLIIEPLTKPFVCASTCHCFHLIDEAVEARQQFLVGTALY